jgi:transposase
LEAVKMRVRARVRLKAELAQMGEEVPFESLDSEASQQAVIDLATVSGLRGTKLQRTLETYQYFTAQRDFWSETLETLAQNLPHSARLAREVPGVGKILAATILGETGPIQRFRSSKALARFTGLTPADRSSAGRTIHGRITEKEARFSAGRWWRR